MKKEKLSNYFDWVKAVWVTARGDPLRFDNRPYLTQIYEDQHENIVYMKSAQMGLSERAVTEAIWIADVLGMNVLYTFPSMAQLQDFVQARIDPVIMSSEYLWSRTEQTDKAVRKVGLKRFGKGHVYLRGSQNEKQIISVDADCIFLDERDRFDQDNVPYIDKRLLASNLKWRREISTPTIPGVGIHAAYMKSDRRVWQVKCKKCGLWQELDFFKNVNFKKKITICRQCKKKVDRLAKGRWKATDPKSDIHGYKINGIYNPMTTTEKLVDEYRLAKLQGFSALQQFYNQVLGYPYEVTGQSITTSELDSCKKDYFIPMKRIPQGCFLGADVGVDMIHAIVLQKTGEVTTKLVWAGTVRKFFGPSNSLEALIKLYDIKYAVVDKRPEVSKVRELVEAFPGTVYAAEYPNIKFPVKEYYLYDDVKYEVRLDRTTSLDYLIGDIQNKRIELPANIQTVDGFYDQLKAAVRVTEKNKRTGVDQTRYVEKGADHYLHTLNYARIAQIRGNIGKALLDYYKEPQEISSPGFMDWLRVRGERIF